jgi:hypothetical protein
VNDIDRGAVGVFSRDGREGNDQQGTLLETSGIIEMPWDLKNSTIWHVFDVTSVARSSK